MLCEEENSEISLPNAEESTPTEPEQIKPTGKVGDKEMTLYEIRARFLTIKENYKPSDKGSAKEFRMLANGF